MMCEAVVDSARVARNYLRGFLEHWTDPGCLDTVVLLTSEVVGNAIRHGTPPVRLAATVKTDRHGSTLRVEVDDEESEVPIVKRPEALDEGGRGMWLVDALADRWGFERHHNAGKTVWYELSVHVPG